MRQKADYRTPLETPPVIADPEELTQKLTLIHFALAGLSLLHGKTLDGELVPIQQAVGDALLLAEAIEKAGVRPPAAPIAVPAIIQSHSPQPTRLRTVRGAILAIQRTLQP
jgi:hypothetical protein